jgi:hypothetical protein
VKVIREVDGQTVLSRKSHGRSSRETTGRFIEYDSREPQKWSQEAGTGKEENTRQLLLISTSSWLSTVT